MKIWLPGLFIVEPQGGKHNLSARCPALNNAKRVSGHDRKLQAIIFRADIQRPCICVADTFRLLKNSFQQAIKICFRRQRHANRQDDRLERGN